jgi:hypothetical protein
VTPADLQSLLVTHLPSAPGIAAAATYPERPYGLAVTLTGGGTVYWMITGSSGHPVPVGARLGPQPLSNLAGPRVPVAEVEQALVTAAAGADSEGHFVRADRYSPRPEAERPAVVYGATLDCADGWKLYLACLGTARQGEQLRANRHYTPDSEV